MATRPPAVPRRLLSLLAAAGLAACGGPPSDEAQLESFLAALKSANGLSTNGLSTNGMSTNGLSTNGLSTNGLSTNGLSNTAFKTWFKASPSYSDMVMTYVARCALADGTSLSFFYGGVTYTWSGLLGLAPGWSAGNAATVAEQQVISACLAAHANKFGVEIPISVRGYKTNGVKLAVTNSEATQFPVDEACFFGNLFDGTGVFSAYSSKSPLIYSSKTSLRACAIDGGVLGNCLPMVSTGSTCQALCNPGDSLEPTQCSWGGKTYKPIAVRLRTADIATCGNAVCEAAEDYLSCPSDCL